MTKYSLPAIPTADQLQEAGEFFGQMLLDNTAAVERRLIYAYGQHLLAGMPATSGLILRFFSELCDLAPRMPGYSMQIARMSLSQSSISDFQNRIAIYVARHDNAQEVV